ncbi:MAG: hypothetical protein ACK56I_20350, partial [bacterium]
VGGRLHVGAGERHGARPVHPGVGVGVRRGAVGKRAGDVHLDAGQREVERLGGAAHGEEEAAAVDEGANPLRHRLLERRDVRLPEGARGGEVAIALRHEPGGVAVGEVELVELPGEVLVVQV